MKLYNKAAADYTEAIRLMPGQAFFYGSRAYSFVKTGKIDKAVKDFGIAIKLAPDQYLNYLSRGLLLVSEKQFGVLEDFKEASRLGPDDSQCHLRLAWLLSTCPDSRFRDGRKALAEATRACTLTSWKNRSCLEALAAASAEVGDFDGAVKWQSQALELLPKDGEEYLRCHRRLSLYEIKVPYRD